MKVEMSGDVLAPPDAAAWDELVQSSDGATVFHTSAWARVWTEEWSHARWEAVVVEDGSRYAGGLAWIARSRGPLETIDSMPYATYGGPLVRRDHPDPVSVRVQLLEAYARRAARKRVLRSQLTWYEGHEAELPGDPEPEEGFTHVLALVPDYERVAEGFSPSTRRLVRQADESGLVVRPAESEEDLRAFLAIAEETVRRRGGKPKPD